jgi:hypothetical protein
MLARFDDDRLSHIQTPSAWVAGRRRMPYCFRGLVLNDVDESAPRWKHEWLEPTAVERNKHVNFATRRAWDLRFQSRYLGKSTGMAVFGLSGNPSVALHVRLRLTLLLTPLVQHHREHDHDAFRDVLPEGR